jgi:hypothetical protein
MSRRSQDIVIFEYVLVVQLDAASQPTITYRYPPQTGNTKDTISGAILRFCFPEAELSEGKKAKKIQSSLSAQQSETFSFVLTESDGSRKFGYCRRMKVQKQKKKSTVLECYCIISSQSSFSMFRQILDIVEEKRKLSKSAVFSFLKTTQAQSFPGPGESVNVRVIGTEEVYTLSRSLGTRFEYLDYVSFSTLFTVLTLPKILELFSNLLLERRCILAAKNLGTLSSCVNAVSALLYPFSWQHVFIPVLPQSLLDYCSAPMPFLLGVLADTIPAIKKLPLEEVIIVDLDKGNFIKNPCFENVLPPHEFRTLEMSLDAIIASGKRGRAFDFDIACAFLDFFQSVLSDYSKFMRGHRLDVQAFLQSRSSEIQKFLRQFEESQMWSCFIQEREIMSEKGTLRNCALLQVQTALSPTITSEKPAVFQVCTKCGCDVEGDTLDKKGRPICEECFTAQTTSRGIGWIKNWRGDSDEGLGSKLGNLFSKTVSKDDKKEKQSDMKKAASSASIPTSPSPTPAAPEKRETLSKPSPAAASGGSNGPAQPPRPAAAPGASATLPPRTPPPAVTRPAPSATITRMQGASHSAEVKVSASAHDPRPPPVPSSVGVSNLASKFATPQPAQTSAPQPTVPARPSAPSSTATGPRTPKPAPLATSSPAPGGEPRKGNKSLPLIPPEAKTHSQELPTNRIRRAETAGPTLSHASSGRPLAGRPPIADSAPSGQPVSPMQGEETLIITSNSTCGARFCSGCGKPFSNEQTVSALNGVWHSQCFVCEHCKQPFNNPKFMVRGDRPYHSACVKQAFGRKCSTCSAPLEGQCVKVEGKQYHSRCFVCATCRAPLTGGFVESQGRNYCVSCSRQTHNSTSAPGRLW